MDFLKLLRALAAVVVASLPAFAQTATLRGVVSDESGAVVPAARVTLVGASGPARTAIAAADGSYSFANLAPGAYSLEIAAPDLQLAQPARITLKPGVNTFHVQLRVAATTQQVTVRDNPGREVSADPANNASALVLRGDDLQALADSPEDLEADLQALAGPSAGPNGGAIYIDGFSGGRLPSKDSIREIRINQNPFAPEYDKLGYGRIEIFTKPGTEKYHGTGFYNFGDSFWNTRDPYAARKAPFLLKEYGGNLSGPLSRRASFFLDVQRHSIDNGSIINAITLDPSTLEIVDPFTGVLRMPQRRIIGGPRIDYQISPSHTLTARYGFARADIRDAGIGSFNLVARGMHNRSTSHTVQLAETAALGTRAVNETRFQFFRADGFSIANNPGPAIQVLGSFNGGGAPAGHSLDTQTNYELQNYTSLIRGAHAWRFGVRLRVETLDNTSPQNFGGTFTFGGGAAPALDAANRPLANQSVEVTSIERYRRTLLGLAGGIPTQFTLSAGTAAIAINQTDLGAYLGDDWRARPNLTLSLGLRYETQSNIGDRRDFAPRVSVAWAPGVRSGKAHPKTVLRAGFGIFYDRFAVGNSLAARRYNGIVQQQYVIANPVFFPMAPPAEALSGFETTRVLQRIDSTLRAPYIAQSAAGVERQLPRSTTVAVTYAQSHGLHMLRSENITAGTPGSAIYLMESSGLYNQSQWIVNVNSRPTKDISLFGFYVNNRARSDTDGIGTFPARPFDYTGEYGPAATDVRHRGSIGGSLTTIWNVRLSPLLTASSGPPFDITVGRDLYGDTLFNARPGIAASPSKAGLIATRYGLLDPNPGPGDTTLPRNYGRGPGSLLFNLRIGRTFSFGGSGEAPAVTGQVPGGGDNRRNSPGFTLGGAGPMTATAASGRRYNLSVSMSIRNVLNRTNPGPIVGNITSPLFGRANQTAGAGVLGGTGFSESANNRRLELQTRLTF